MSSLFAFLHHMAAFVLMGALFAELMLVKQEVNERIARTLLRLDAIYGVSALALIVFGLVRVHFTEKGAAYYFHSAPFIAKMILFIAVGLISIYPTRRFIAWRGDLKAGRTPILDSAIQTKLRKIVHLELALLGFVILCAVLMARGVGYFG